jgi:hypothetical protein
MKSTALILIACLTASTACSTITVNPQGELKRTDTPSYSDRKNFYLWGLAGEHHVNVKQACMGREAVQMQTNKTATDGLLSLVTLGIYWPRHTHIWCNSDT